MVAAIEDRRDAVSSLKLFGMKVDPVMVGALKNRYIARDVGATRQVLYAA